MRRLKNITLEKLAAHYLDHISGKKTISREATPFSEEAGTFITQHLRKCSALQRPRAASFEDPPGAVALSCRRILSRPSLFVEESANIAEALYESMGKNQNIEAGFLVVCLCKNDEENYRFIALLKMDPHPIFRGRLGHSVEIVHEGNALPDPQAHLQKFAFVRKGGTESMPEILVLDMQARADEVAEFFQRHFLRCHFSKDDTLRTKEFYGSVRNWVNGKVAGHEMTPENATEFMAACDAALRAKHINVEAFARAHITEPDQVNDLLDYFAAKALDTEFTVDPDSAARFQRTRKIRLDKAEIKIKDVDMTDPSFFSATTDPDNPAVTIVQMRTSTYHYLS